MESTSARDLDRRLADLVRSERHLVVQFVVELAGFAKRELYRELGYTSLFYYCVRQLGLEFLPHLEEGNMWIRATMPTSISLQEGNGYVNRMRNIIRGYPEVQTIVSQNGRPDDGSHPGGQ